MNPSRIFKCAVLCAFLLALLIIPLNSPVDATPLTAPAQLFIVNTTLDYEDCNPGNGVCDPGTWDVGHTVCTPAPGVCTLRAAIQEANAGAGADEIVFSFVAQPIRPLTALPYITDAITINGIDQGHGGSVRLDGALAPAGTNGLHLWASNSTIRGMTITGFKGDGTLNGCGIVVDGDNNVVEGNFLGTNTAGLSGLGNGNSGIIVADGADNNRIGGTTPAQRNVISGNYGHGIQIGNAVNNIGASGNRIIGNYIGVAPDGQAALGNAYTGVAVFYATSTNNQIGGTATGERNIIAGNGQHGVALDQGTSGNLVLGNYIGTNVSGTVELPNASVGVLIHQSSNNTIGGTTAAARNIIAASGLSGVEISVPPLMATTAPSASPVSYGLRREGEPSAPISEPAALAAPANGNIVQGNYIGIDVSGTQAFYNLGNGVLIYNASQNQIGGTATGAGNVIAGNRGNGVFIQAVGGSLATGNLVQGNIIGLDATGLAALANNNGVAIYNASQNTIGGTTIAARNVIAGNAGNGVQIWADAGAVAEGNRVQGNLIGLQAGGMALAPNTHSGVMIYDASLNIIGGAEAGAGNVIAGNGQNGVTIQVVNGTALSNTVQGNLIGTYQDGSFSDPDEVPGSGDDPGNRVMGIGLEGASGNQIGGATLAARNIIAGNALGGIYVFRPGATGNQIQGNFVGLLAAETPAGNGGVGVWIAEGSRNLIGGTGAATNTIAFNADVGVLIADNAISNTLQGNAIYLNTGRPVDLDDDGLTPNDLGDADTGANQRQNFPDILAVKDTVVTGTLSSAPYTTYRVEFFAYEVCSFAREFPVGYGDGEQYLTFKNITTDARGDAAFTVTLASALPDGYTVAATATDPQGNTSEFSNSPYKLRVSSSTFAPSTVFTQTVLLYSILDQGQAQVLTGCIGTSDLYIVANNDLAHPRKMENDGKGLPDRVKADFSANDVHHSLWFTPTQNMTYTLDLYVVAAGRPFDEAVLSDRLRLTPQLKPKLVVLTDFSELFREFNLTRTNSARGDANGNLIRDYYEAVERIRRYAVDHQGVVVDVRQTAYTADWSYTQSTFVRRIMGSEIDAWLYTLSPLASLEHIAIIGDDAVLPFYRFLDPKPWDERCYLMAPDADGNRCQISLSHGVATVLDTQQNYIMTDVPYSTRANTTPFAPDVDWNLGRIFAPAPLSLVSMIDGYEKPAVVGPLTGSAFTFNIANELKPDGTVKFNWQSNSRTIVESIRDFGYNILTFSTANRGKPHHRLWLDATTTGPWQPVSVRFAMDNPASGPRLTLLNSHAKHYYNTTPIALHFTSQLLDGLALFPGSVFVDVGCHAGYSTGYDATVDPKLWNYYADALVRAALERNITYHASTTFGKTTAGAEMRFNDRVHYQFLRFLFSGAATSGEAHRRAIRTYTTYHSAEHFEVRDVIGIYGTELYGLPTQPIRRKPGAVTVQQLATGSAAPTAPQATGTLTASFDVPVFRITAEGDATRFEVPHDGEMTGVGNGPLVPVLARSFYFPAGTTDLNVTLVASDTALYPTAVQLPLQQAGDRTWGVETVPFTGTALYPAELFWTTVYSDARGVQLTLSAIPLRYDPLTGQVTLYHHLQFQVDYALPDSGTLAPTAAPDITALDINGGAPVDVDQASLPLSLTVTVAEDGPLTLRWVIEDAAGQPVRGDIDVVTLTAGVNVLAWETDSLGWQPGPKVLHAQLEDAEDIVLATAQTPFTAQGRSLAVTTDRPLYGPDATQAIARAEVRDTTGALVPGLSGALAASLDGVVQALVWQGDGVYTATLDVSALTAISHTLEVTLPGGPADATPFSVDRVAPAASLSSPEIVYAPQGIPVTIDGDDDLSGVAAYRLQYRIGETGAWTDWLTRETTWNYDLGAPADLTPLFGPTQPVALEDKVTYYFRVQAVDWAGNVETLHADADTWTTYIQPQYVYLPLVLRAYDSSVVPPNTRYVKRYGTDAGNCLTPATACGTIQYAADVALDGDIIAIAGYADAYTLENPGGDPRYTYSQTSYRPKPDGYYGPDSVAQVVLVEKSLTLRGGYAADFSARNPALYKTVLRPGLSGGAGRGILIAPFVAVTLEDLYILEGDATGLGGAYHNTYGSYDAGGGVHALGVSYRQDALVIRNCIIAGNRASASAYAEGGGVYVENRSGARLIGNRIYDNRATGGTGQGGGIMVRGGANVRLEANTVTSNTGSVYGNFQGGGVCLFGLSNPVIQGNTIAANVATEEGARVLGGGLYMDSVTGALISGNIIRDNVGGGYELGSGGGVSIYQSQNITLRGNIILGNIAAYADATGTASSGGGVRVSSGCANIVLENNIIARNQSPYAGSGLLFTPNSVENLVVTLRHNTIADNRLSESANQRISESVNLESRITNYESVDERLIELAHLQSSISQSSISQSSISQSSIPQSAMLLAVPKESQGIMTVYNVTLNAVNTIVAGHTRGIFELFPGEGTLKVDYTLWYANTTNADPTVTRTNDRFGSPDFVNPTGGDYHIGANSAARDAGPEVGVTTDIDGDVRDDLPDIGADEYMQP